MQDKLKRHIENQGDLDDQEPGLEHRSHFAELLNKELHQKPKGINLTISYSFMRVAAIGVLLITAISFAWFWDQSRINVENNTPSMTLADVSEKYKQVEFFYQEQMSVRLAQLAIMLVSKGGMCVMAAHQDVQIDGTVVKVNLS